MFRISWNVTSGFNPVPVVSKEYHYQDHMGHPSAWPSSNPLPMIKVSCVVMVDNTDSSTKGHIQMKQKKTKIDTISKLKKKGNAATKRKQGELHERVTTRNDTMCC